MVTDTKTTKHGEAAQQDLEPRFWEKKSLTQMNRREWEALCDGCGKCCLHKLEDADNGAIYHTRVVCRYFDENSCRCQVYETRRTLVPECLDLTQENLDELHWMPDSCAYRLLHEGRELPAWHPLVAGTRDLIASSGNTISGKVISEEHVHPDGYDEHIVNWVN